jgi:hypothetical protein
MRGPKVKEELEGISSKGSTTEIEETFSMNFSLKEFKIYL